MIARFVHILLSVFAVLFVTVSAFPASAQEQDVNESLTVDNEDLLESEKQILNSLKSETADERKFESESVKVDNFVGDLEVEKAFRNIQGNIFRSPVKETDKSPAEEAGPPAQNMVVPAQPARKVNRAPKVVVSKSQTGSKARELQAKLNASEKRARILLAELKKARNQLLVAETEVERLSRMLENRTGTYTAGEYKAKEKSGGREHYVSASQKPVSSDMPIATVITSKANLRTGPGKDNSPIMTVSRGSRLVVEKRLGKWYRVLAPNGTRAWISGNVVAFGKNNVSGPTRTVEVKSYDPDIE